MTDELVDVIHRPENRVLHDRMGERALTRPAAAVAAIIASGIERGHSGDRIPSAPARG